MPGYKARVNKSNLIGVPLLLRFILTISKFTNLEDKEWTSVPNNSVRWKLPLRVPLATVPPITCCFQYNRKSKFLVCVIQNAQTNIPILKIYTTIKYCALPAIRWLWVRRRNRLPLDQYSRQLWKRRRCGGRCLRSLRRRLRLTNKIILRWVPYSRLLSLRGKKASYPLLWM